MDSIISFLKEYDQLIFATSSLVVSVVAICISIYQVRLSNRQKLFDRRVDTYLVARELLSIFSKKQEALTNAICIVPDLMFIILTNNSYLKEMTRILNRPQEEGDIEKFFKKKEWLETKAIELKLIWQTNEARLISQFIQEYAELLFLLCQQSIFIYRLEKKTEDMPRLDNEFQKETIKNAEKLELLQAASNIKEIYREIEAIRAEKKLFDSIKL